MKQINFSIQGSAKEPYEVAFIKGLGDKIIATCTCPAGKFGGHCKHRVGILTNSANMISDLDPESIAMVQSWILGSPIETFLNDYIALEDEVAERQKRLKKMKARLADILKGK